MKLAYLITEHKETALILKHLLPQHLVQVTKIVATSTRSSAQSLAGTLMSERSRPVALVLNANTIDTSSIQETTHHYYHPTPACLLWGTLPSFSRCSKCRYSPSTECPVT